MCRPSAPPGKGVAEPWHHHASRDIMSRGESAHDLPSPNRPTPVSSRPRGGSLATLPVVSWRSISNSEPGVRHLPPIAPTLIRLLAHFGGAVLAGCAVPSESTRLAGGPDPVDVRMEPSV
jgi:hypothetical protein